MTDLNPQTRYTFKSAKGGQEVIITSRLGEDSARNAAMFHIWGPPKAYFPNVGTGLHLTRVEDLG